MPVIYHITFQSDWETAKSSGLYTHPSLVEEGFIHCSSAEQVSGVLDRYFAGKKNLVKLVIDVEKLTWPCVYDWSEAMAEEFPHIYGSINLDAVIETIPL